MLIIDKDSVNDVFDDIFRHDRLRLA